MEELLKPEVLAVVVPLILVCYFFWELKRAVLDLRRELSEKGSQSHEQHERMIDILNDMRKESNSDHDDFRDMITRQDERTALRAKNGRLE